MNIPISSAIPPKSSAAPMHLNKSALNVPNKTKPPSKPPSPNNFPPAQRIYPNLTWAAEPMLSKPSLEVVND